jgi:hypothetical protein
VSVTSPSLCRRAAAAAIRWRLLTLLAVGVLYLGLTTGLTWNLDPEPLRSRDHFDRLADAFLAGRTHLDLHPDQAKLDMSVHGGRVYLYWGPGNALPALLARILTVPPRAWRSSRD